MNFNHITHITIIIAAGLAFAAGAHAQNVDPVEPDVVASTSARLAQLKATRDVVLGAVVPW